MGGRIQTGKLDLGREIEKTADLEDAEESASEPSLPKYVLATQPRIPMLQNRSRTDWNALSSPVVLQEGSAEHLDLKTCHKSLVKLMLTLQKCISFTTQISLTLRSHIKMNTA